MASDSEPMIGRIAVTDHNFPDLSIEKGIFQDAGYTVHDLQADTPQEIIEGAKDAEAILVQWAEIDQEIINCLNDVEVIGRYGIGIDNIDVDAASDEEIEIINVPDYCIHEVAEHALGLLLSSWRRIPAYSSSISEGDWDWKVGRDIYRFSGKTVGLVGFGKIAQQLVGYLDGFNVAVSAYDPHISRQEMSELDVEKTNFEALLTSSDAISIHAPLTAETEGLFGWGQFERMRDDAILVNSSRGGIIRTDELIEALEQGEIRGAALDVLEEEPPSSNSLLRQMDNVILTPHASWYSEESIIELREKLAKYTVEALTEA